MLKDALMRLSAGDIVKSALVSDDVMYWLEVMNVDELSSLIRLYNNLIPHIKTQVPLQLADILNCFSTLPEQPLLPELDSTLSLLCIYLAYLRKSPIDFKISSKLDLQVLDKLLPLSSFKVDLLCHLNKFDLATKSIILMYKKGMVNEEELKLRLKNIMQGS